MLSLAQALALAVKQHQQGDLFQAEQLYRQILQVDPQQIDALHLLGLIAHQTGRPAEAVASIRRALQLRPDFADAHYNLGQVLQRLGKPAEAEAHLAEAGRVRPRPPAGWQIGRASCRERV